jgi:hypothetical protein
MLRSLPLRAGDRYLIDLVVLLATKAACAVCCIRLIPGVRHRLGGWRWEREVVPSWEPDGRSAPLGCSRRRRPSSMGSLGAEGDSPNITTFEAVKALSSPISYDDWPRTRQTQPEVVHCLPVSNDASIAGSHPLCATPGRLTIEGRFADTGLWLLSGDSSVLTSDVRRLTTPCATGRRASRRR